MSPAVTEALGMMGGDGPAPAQESESDPRDLIRQALELVRQYAAQEESEQGTLDAEKITTLLQQILASEEKELEQAMQGKASPRMLRSAYA